MSIVSWPELVGLLFRKPSEASFAERKRTCDGKLQEPLERIAEKNGRRLGDVVGDMLVKDVELLEKLA